MDWAILILWIAIGIMNMPSVKTITKAEYFLCWTVLIFILIDRALK